MILTLNAGSSSLKWGLYDTKNDALFVTGSFHGIGSGKCTFTYEDFFKGKRDTGVGEEKECLLVPAESLQKAIFILINFLLKERFIKNLKAIEAVGHRFVHGGSHYTEPVVVDKETERDLKALNELAPLHNPQNLAGIHACKKFLSCPQIAVFDTAFHQTLEPKAYLYGISLSIAEEYGVRKYGFHGINHEYSSLKAAEILGKMPERMVICHLGNGSSITAVRDGLSVETSMGFTPTDGVIMGTRSGAIDPGAVLHLQEVLGLSAKKMDALLNNESGLKAIAGVGDVEQIWHNAQQEDPRAKLALDMLAHRVTHYIGAYAALLGGLDCLVFTAGIGENAYYVREAVCKNLAFLGVQLDAEKNERQ